MVHGMPKPCVFPSLDSCQKRFLWTHEEVDLAPHPLIGLLLQVWDAKKFPQVLRLKRLDLFLTVSKQGPGLTALQEDWDDKRLVQLEVARSYLIWPSLPLPRRSFSQSQQQGPCLTAIQEDGDDKRLVQLEVLEIASIAVAVLVIISAEQAPSFGRVGSGYL